MHLHREVSFGTGGLHEQEGLNKPGELHMPEIETIRRFSLLFPSISLFRFSKRKDN